METQRTTDWRHLRPRARSDRSPQLTAPDTGEAAPAPVATQLPPVSARKAPPGEPGSARSARDTSDSAPTHDSQTTRPHPQHASDAAKGTSDSGASSARVSPRSAPDE